MACSWSLVALHICTINHENWICFGLHSGWIKGETFRYQLGFLEMVITADILSVILKKKAHKTATLVKNEKKTTSSFNRKSKKSKCFLEVVAGN